MRWTGFLLLLLTLGLTLTANRPQTHTDPESLLAEVRRIIAANDVRALRVLGETPEVIHWHIWLTGDDRLPNWSADLLPAPKGYGKPGEWWLLFSKFQLVEELCDRAHPIVQTPNGLKLAPEVPESVAVPFRIEFHDIELWLEPKARSVRLRNRFSVKRVAPDEKALLMRLNAPYRVKSVKFNGAPIPLITRFSPDSRLPDTLWAGRVGGLLWIQDSKPLPDAFTVEIEYEGTIWYLPNDRVGEQYALLCSYWYPHIGRLPARHRVTVHTPPDWIAIGQGELQKETRTDSESVFTYQNDLPVCFFSMVAGPFQVGAEVRSQHSNRLIRVYQLRVDRARAEQIARKTAQAMDYFESILTPYPYTHFYVVETPQFGFSGLEAYSFTFLDPAITLWACSHELAHTWWGGIVPNTYINSIWNESLTQYTDSVLFQKGADGTMQVGAQSINGRTVPIGSANVARDDVMAIAGYMRGAYVLKMLENELGHDTMLEAMRRFIRNRAGQASEWEHFLQAVNEVTQKDYRWFFDQWIFRAEFPALEITPLEVKAVGDRWEVVVRLRQSGTSRPYRLRLPLRLMGERGVEAQHIVYLTEAEQTLTLQAPFAPKWLTLLEDSGDTLVRKPSGARGNPFHQKLGN